MLDTYKLRPDQMEQILFIDAMARFVGAKVGDIILIERASNASGQVHTYRHVKDTNLEMTISHFTGS